MKWLKTVAGEIYSLFVDDVSFALSVLGCVALAALVLRRVASLAPFSGAVLFAGLALLLMRSALRFPGGKPH